MPSERSLYHKIRVAIDIAKSVKTSDLAGLSSEIRDRNSPIFYSSQFDGKTDSFVDRISDKVINKTLRMCVILGLLSEDGSLTPEGREVLRRTRFDTVIGNQICRYFKKHQIDIANINSVIEANVHSYPPVLPTCRVIWSVIDTDMGYGLFSRMLTLLAHCGGATCSQAKIYLSVNNIK